MVCPALRQCGNDEEWYAKLPLLFVARDGNREEECAFVHWYEDDASPSAQTAATGMRCLRPAKRRHPRREAPCAAARYDVIRVSTIQRPVYIQPDPQKQGVFFVNHFFS